MLDPPWDAENQISIALSRSVSQTEGPTSCQFSMKIIISLWTSCVCVCGFVWGVGGGGTNGPCVKDQEIQLWLAALLQMSIIKG